MQGGDHLLSQERNGAHHLFMRDITVATDEDEIARAELLDGPGQLPNDCVGTPDHDGPDLLQALLCGRTCQALFIAFRTSCHTGPCGRSNGSVSPDLCWWLRDPWSSLAPNDLLSVVTSRGVTHPILHALWAPVKPGVDNPSS
jgi:hypothetical protein